MVRVRWLEERDAEVVKVGVFLALAELFGRRGVDEGEALFEAGSNPFPALVAVAYAVPYSIPIRADHTRQAHGCAPDDAQ